MSRILLVDDDEALLRALSVSFSARGYEVDIARTGEEALDRAARGQPEVILLDLGLPGIGGIDVIHGIRGWSRVPIIVLSARHHGATKVEALDAGADDYVTKPFAMDELLARVRAALRRTGEVAGPPTVDTVDFTVDRAARVVVRDGEELHLTPKEWGVLEVLVRNAGKFVSYAEILQEVWGAGYSTETDYVRVVVRRLRRKLEPNPSHPVHLLTVAGMGYRFEV